MTRPTWADTLAGVPSRTQTLSNPARTPAAERTARATSPWEAGTPAERPSAAGVTIVVPVYNEERGVAGVLERLSKLDLGAPVQLVAVNDGSIDGTARVLGECAGRIPNLRVVTHRAN